MAKKYTGSLTLDWYNKQKAILLTDSTILSDKLATSMNWVNRDEALFYEIDESEGRGIAPYWVAKDDIRVKEARPLIHQKTFKASSTNTPGTIPGITTNYTVGSSDVEDKSVDNILIKGDNLLALNSLKKLFANNADEDKIKCIYIDPPYNIGTTFQHYDDNLENSEWLTMFRDRLQALHSLLSEGGFICVQLDDSQGPYGKIVMDDVFGKQNFIVTMYVQVRYNDKTLKEDMLFNKLIEQVHIYRKVSSSKAIVNRESVEYSNEKFNVKITELGPPSSVLTIENKRVEIFAHGSYSIDKVAPSKDGLKEIWASGSILDGNSSGRFFRDFITGREKIDGLKTLYKVSGIGDDGLGYRYFTGPQKETATRGKYFQGMPTDKRDELESTKFVPISNFIDLAASFGNCRHEGGVEFKSGKKPEVLLAKLFEMATAPGDYILDCFGGSGSTFATAHKMGRRWIGVEVGKHADSHIVPRMTNVISGTDKTGISKEYQWAGGGAFRYYHLGPSIISFNAQGEADFNWSLGKSFLEESFLTSYDYTQVVDTSFISADLFADKASMPKIGLQQVGSKSIIAVVSLNEPDGPQPNISFDELRSLYAALKAKFAPQYINVFTNRGVELAYDSKPDDLEVFKIPHAIFAELEK